MAGIYRSLYYADVTVGSGGRLTIPQEVREDLKIEDGNSLTLRVEESPDGQRQRGIWKAPQQPEEQVSGCSIPVGRSELRSLTPGQWVTPWM
jgi:bifunctional DNA-binding transcriptional regulator/antitoxin component of YhaV-PrlF toxin-antitoxin module